MDEIEVYRFAVWASGKLTENPSMATRATIRRAKGEADLHSLRRVPTSQVNSEGFYEEQSPPGSEVVRF